MKPVLHSGSSSNGFSHRRVEKEAWMNNAQPSVDNTGFVYIFRDIYIYTFTLM